MTRDVARYIFAGTIEEGAYDAFARWLERTSARSVEVVLNTPGGSGPDAVKIADRLWHMEPNARAVIARADSAGLFIAAGCRHRVAVKDATALVHDPTAVLDRAFHPRDAEQLERATNVTRRDLAAILSRATTTAASTYEFCMSENDGHGSTFDADRLFAWGLVQEVLDLTGAEFLAQTTYDAGGDPDPQALASMLQRSLRGHLAIQGAWQRHAARLGRIR